MKKLIVIVLGCLYCSFSKAQITIGDESILAIGGVFATNHSITNAGSVSCVNESLITLSGQGTLTGVFNVVSLKHTGEHDLDGSLDISNQLTLDGGIITPKENAYLSLALSASVVSHNQGFINGPLYQQGTGEKFYPLGKNGTYTPVVLTKVQGDEDVIVGIEAFNKSLDIGESVQGWYWEIQPNGNFKGSLVQLPILDAGGEVYTVLQSDGTNSTNLGGTLIDDFTSIESEQLAVGPYVLLGKNGESSSPLTIHNIVTPDREDGKNDAFYIENIEKYSENTVILMDRWGTEVCRMENFSNDPITQKGCDLQRLPAGNYICVVKHSGTKSKPVLITILK